MAKVQSEIARAVVFLAVMASARDAAAKPEYITSAPLVKTVTATVADCAAMQPVQVPIITWGGDIPTIRANGDNRVTQKGSLFDRQGLQIKLAREDVFSNQVTNYLKCQSPYLRGTLGMIGMAAEITDRDPRTKLVLIYLLTWSAGGDALVVKDGINSPKDLRGKTVALQAYGPHVDYLGKILSDAGLGFKDVTVTWVKDLTGGDNTPPGAFYEADVHAAMVIIPDALALTSNGAIGTGAEDSVKGARILMSTRTANRVIADVYAVRSDYFNAHRDEVQKFTHALFLADEETRTLAKNKASSAYQDLMTASAEILLDSPQAVKDAEGMYMDAEFARLKGNVRFFTDAKHPRHFDVVTGEIQDSFMALGLNEKRTAIKHAGWDYTALQAGVSTVTVNAPKFDANQVANVVTLKQQQGSLGEGELYSFEVYFQPNQNAFATDLYSEAFRKVIGLSATYGGAIITIEGHSDPLGYLKQKKAGESDLVLTRVKQSAKNLSLTRANAVRDSLIEFAKGQSVTLDMSQFAVVGHGIAKPKSGVCGEDPCAPATKQDWLNNMRVEFRIIQVEAETDVFNPL